MPRARVQYCNENPYHVTAKSNNGDWFDIPMDYIYGIYINVLSECIKRYKIKVHAFVLMSNHFHLIITTPNSNIGEVLRYFMTETSRGISTKSQRKNHIYGGRNHKTIITEPTYYAHCLKYVLRNPVKAGLCAKIEEYKWSSMSKQHSKMKKLITPIGDSHNAYIPTYKHELFDWLNTPTPKEIEEQCRKAFKRKVFEFKPSRKNQKQIDPKKTLLHK